MLQIRNKRGVNKLGQDCLSIGDTPMAFGIAHIQPIVALIAGILILVAPWLLNYIVAIYLILVGIIGLGIIH